MKRIILFLLTPLFLLLLVLAGLLICGYRMSEIRHGYTTNK